MCRPLEGQRVTDSQAYPEKMVKAMLRALRAEARLRDSLRFSKPICVMYAKPEKSVTAFWRNLNQACPSAFN